MRAKGFSLVELLTSVGIVAVLCALAAPVLRTSQVALAKHRAMFSLKALGAGTSLYLADCDETYPLGMNTQPDGGLLTWFGQVHSDNTIDIQRGALSAYLGATVPKDPTAPPLPFLGNGGGFGYNYETLGSDFTETGDFSHYPDCENAATASVLNRPSETIAFATSVYYRPTWTKSGDGKEYDFGFLTPPWAWNGNPTMSFRHGGERKDDRSAKSSMETGNALVLFADGRAKAVPRGDVTDKLFLRNPASFAKD